jgi:hypothetical protein
VFGRWVHGSPFCEWRRLVPRPRYTSDGLPQRYLTYHPQVYRKFIA